MSLLIGAGALLLGACTSTAPGSPSARVTIGSGSKVEVTQAPPPVSADAGVVALQNQFEKVVEDVQPSVVQIETAVGLGSGVVFDDKGDIVTNNHVVEGYGGVLKVTTSDGHTYTDGVTLLGTYPADDLAVIRVPNGNLHPATFADSSNVKVGELALALGNPLGLQSSVTEGIVSAVGRTLDEPGSGPFSRGQGPILTNLIQTSAPINPGNSGGALVDISGQVIGIPTLAANSPQSGQAPGIGFAIDSNTAVTVAQQLIASGHVTNTGRAYLGVTTQDIPSGVLISSVVGGGPAAAAGIKEGDIIVSVDGKPVPTHDDLVSVLAQYKPGDKVQVRLHHGDGTFATVTVTLGTLPAQ